MTWLRFVAAGLALTSAGYMLVDGLRALIAGDYFTPSSGEHAGELGPWATIVAKVGIDPRSTGMKSFFVAYGLAWLFVIVMFVLRAKWAWAGMLILAAGSLWYLTVGTVVGVVVVAILLIPAVRAASGP